jgi:hypothetical protein
VPFCGGGLGDEQAMRVLMLLARTGRRVNEICMLDRDPLLPLDTAGPRRPGDDGGFVARLRYQQTKIEAGPDTILVDQEITSSGCPPASTCSTARTRNTSSVLWSSLRPSLSRTTQSCQTTRSQSTYLRTPW